MRRLSFQSLLAVLPLLNLMACKPGDSVPPPAAPPSAETGHPTESPDEMRSPEDERQPPFEPTGRGVSNDGNFTVAYATEPHPIPLNEPFNMTVAIFQTESPDRIAREITLYPDAAMPAHGHGMNRKPTTTPNADGTFRVTGMLFHMPGHWELYFDVTHGVWTERTQFDVDLD